MSTMEGLKQYRSRAELKRLANEHKRELVLSVQAARQAGEGAPPPKRQRAPSEGGYGRDKSGLEWLRDKGKITAAQAKMGERYGRWWRGASIEGAHFMRSCLDDSVRGGSGTGLPPDSTENAEWIADCRAKIGRAHLALNNVSGMVAVLVVVCGHGQRIRDIPELNGREEIAEVETALRIALDILIACEL